MDDVVIWGAGAIGGTIGAYLARAGANPLLVDTDAAHVAALNANGLKITGPIEEFSVSVRAVTPQRPSLEQFFLSVAESQAQPESAPDSSGGRRSA